MSAATASLRTDHVVDRPALGGSTATSPPPSMLTPASRHTTFAAVAALATACLTGCAPAEFVAAPAPAASPFPAASSYRLPPAALTRRLLEGASAGLLYTSESDYPFTYVSRPGPAPAPLTVAAFRAAFAVPADTPVEVISLDEFFTRHIERVDPADRAAVARIPRYVVLRETLRRVVRSPQVFRVGRIAIDCYAVGTDAQGNVVGLSTVSIET